MPWNCCQPRSVAPYGTCVACMNNRINMCLPVSFCYRSTQNRTGETLTMRTVVSYCHKQADSYYPSRLVPLIYLQRLGGQAHIVPLIKLLERIPEATSSIRFIVIWSIISKPICSACGKPELYCEAVSSLRHHKYSYLDEPGTSSRSSSRSTICCC